MATSKRKRKCEPAQPDKRPKHAHRDEELPSYWEAEAILKESGRGGKIKYLIEWKGTDPSTGKAYAPSWEPAEYANNLLVSSWEAKKAEKKAVGKAARSGSTASPAQHKVPRRTPKANRSPKTLVVDNSPDPSTTLDTPVWSRKSTPTCEAAGPAPTSSALTTPIVGPESPRQASPQIEIRARGSSFDRDAHEYVSQLPPSQPEQTQPSTQATDLDSSALFAAVPEQQSPGIIPDSQSSQGEHSFIPPTQHTTETTQQALGSSNIQDEVTDDSGLLEIVQNAASRANSPARSIPETVFDTTTQSDSLQHQANSQEPTEISGTFELVESSSQATHGASQLAVGGASGNSEQQNCVQRVGQLQEENQDQETIVPPTSVSETVQAVSEVAPQDCIQPANPSASVEHNTELLSDRIGPQEEPVLDPAQKEPEQSRSREPGRSLQVQESDHSSTTEAEEDNVAVSRQETPAAESAVTNRQDACDKLGLAYACDNQHVQAVYQSPHRQPTTLIEIVSTQDTPASVVQDESIASDLSQPTGLCTAKQPAEQSSSTIRSEECDNSTRHSSNESEARIVDDSSEQHVSDNLISAATVQEQAAVLDVPNTELIVPSTYALPSVEKEATQENSKLSRSPRAAVDCTESQDQHAQVIPFDPNITTQDDPDECILPTVEKPSSSEASSPSSRHDSSQDSPGPSVCVAEQSSSSIPQPLPPIRSLDLFNTELPPPRPKTPNSSSSSFVMTEEDSGAHIARRLAEEMAKERALHPFTPPRRRIGVPPSGPTSALPPDSSISKSLHQRLLRKGASPSTAGGGTRSPSSIPDRPPAPVAPTSLRTIALSQSNQKRLEEEQHIPREEAEEASKGDPSAENADLQVAHAPTIMTTEPTIPEVQSSGDDENSDADDDSESLLNDDLQLGLEEYIVPLSIEGAQKKEYTEHIKTNRLVLEQFLNNPGSFESFSEVEEVLSKLRATEIHPDLVFAEAVLPSHEDVGQATQALFAEQWSRDNSVKFRFLHTMLTALKRHDKHIVLLIDQDNDKLFNILEQFCSTQCVNWSIPSRDKKAHSTDPRINLSITIMSSNESPVLQPVDVIVCIDGVQDAAQIRQQNWAANPELNVVPVLHLVIPRSVGHIERYISTTLDTRKRIHTIFASLQHMLGEIGSPIDEDTAEAEQAAALVIEWLDTTPENRGDWPLVSIGSVKDAVEFETQTSPVNTPVPERAKRPHEDEELDPAKRVRLTPQPQAAASSSINNELTRISDSVSGTAAEGLSQLRGELERLKAEHVHLSAAYQRERTLRAGELVSSREREAMWEKQQTVHEDLAKTYGVTLGEKQRLERELEALEKNNASLRERLSTRTEGLRTANLELEQQRSTHLLSDDEKTVSITKLRKELAQAKEDKARALRDTKQAEERAEYSKEKYREAQEAAASSQKTVNELQAQNAKLQQQASGEAAKLKALHLNNQHENQTKTIQALRAEVSILKKTLTQKEEDIQRAKMSGGRMGVGTRATSATPQPRTRSRAASPMGGRVSNLRNG